MMDLTTINTTTEGTYSVSNSQPIVPRVLSPDLDALQEERDQFAKILGNYQFDETNPTQEEVKE